MFVVTGENVATPARVARPAIWFRGAIGFMVGMYLFIFGPIVRDAFVRAATVAPMPLNLDPLQWTALIFCLGLVLDFILEVPTGVFADVLGRKVALIASLVFRFFNLLVMFLLVVLQSGQNPQGPWTIVGLLVFYWIFYVFYWTLQSGAYEAWLNSSLKEAKCEGALAWALAQGENAYNIGFLVGALFGMLLWATDKAYLAYVGGMGLSIACACICGLSMRENRGADLSGKPEDRKSWRDWWDVFWNSAGELRNRNLLIVFLVNAAVTALVNLVNLGLFIFLESHFFPKENGSVLAGSSRQNELLAWSVGATFVLALATLLGNLVFSHWLGKRLKAQKDLSVRVLVWVNIAFNAVLTIPVAAAAFLFANANANAYTPKGAFGLSMLIGLMAVHKLGASTYRVANTTLQRDLISQKRKETATILSLGGALKNFVIMGLVFFGVGREPASLLTWAIPAVAVVLVSVVMVLSVRAPRPVEKEAVKKTEASTV